MRQERVVERALPGKHQGGKMTRKKKNKKNKKNFATSGNVVANNNDTTRTRPKVQREIILHDNIVEKWIILFSNVGGNLMQNAASGGSTQVATCLLGSGSSESWLIGSGCTKRMTYDKELFKELKSIKDFKSVKIGNGQSIAKLTKICLSIGQLIEKGFKVYFEDILHDKKLFKVKMRGKNFTINPLK
ncbi:hypothetical protein CR513_01263, partial [Mucuna pruriens]